MAKEEQIKFCKKCLNRKFDAEQGIICRITGLKPSFEIECRDFKRDKTVKKRVTYRTKSSFINGDKIKIPSNIYKDLRSQQNLLLAISAGILAGIIGAVIWFIITVSTGFQIGYMALLIGAGVGLSIRFAGKGMDRKFGISGAIIALLSCLSGNLLSAIGFTAGLLELGFFETLSMFGFGFFPQVMYETSGPIDILFYGIAVVEAYKFSFRNITSKDIQTFKIKAD